MAKIRFAAEPVHSSALLSIGNGTTACFLKLAVWSLVLHVLSFVHVPRPSPLALGVFVASHSLSVDLLALFLPPQILFLLLFRCGDVEVCAGLRALRLLSRHKTVWCIVRHFKKQVALLM